MAKEIEGVFLNDPKMSDEDLDQVDILPEAKSIEGWKEFVSGVNRHFMLLQNDEWPAQIVSKNKVWYRWHDDWNEDRLGRLKVVSENLGISSSEPLYIFWMREIGVKTIWEVFCNNWINFLYEDEGCILVFPGKELALIFSNGNAWHGLRTKPKT